LIRIAVSARAYRAIKATLPEGSVVYPPERNDRGQYLLWLSEAEATLGVRPAPGDHARHLGQPELLGRQGKVSRSDAARATP
jgi:hypothetical protein